jgi:DNA-binding SARP family transcriptional activator/tetratricopeptide (TPR) repeat protein
VNIEGGRMEFRLFGAVELWAAGRLLDVGTPRQQQVLAALVVDTGRPVAIETLIDRVWDDTPPAEARNVLYSHLSRIRRLFAQAAGITGETAAGITRRHAGYVVDVDPDMVDLHRFNGLVGKGRDSERTDAERAELLNEALHLWTGPPLAGLSGRWVTRVRTRWHQLRLDAVAQWAQVELRLGHPAAVVTVLRGFVDEYPLVEPLEGLLMRALLAAGRGAEAVDRYSAVRRRFADDLGTDPGVELRSLHQAILRGDPPLPESAAASSRPLASPAQLPPDLPGFTGRVHELRQLDDLLAAARDRATAVVITTVSGTAGIGKTALAVHWAHRVRSEFPDGQLYVNLRGHDPSGSPVPPADAVRGFLDALGVAPERIPPGFEPQVGLYRSLLAGRRVLMVLDNVRDAEQARPLLPGAAGCLVVATSRSRLSGLVTEGAHPLTLDLLSAGQARELLARRVGTGRVAGDPHAVEEIIASCARLPLALAIVATRAATQPDFPLEVLAAELREARGSLDTFASTDLATDVRAVFSWSYRQLSPEAATVFRLLGLHFGPDIATPAAASLAGMSPHRVRRVLAELVDAHLITEHVPGRFAFHDLLRAYAAEQGHTTDSDERRRVVRCRALDHYLHTAHSAAMLLQPTRDPIALASAHPGVTTEHVADVGQALTWFTAEHAVLLRAIDHATRSGEDTRAWQVAWTLTDYLNRQGHWHDAVTTGNAALAAARRLTDPDKQALAHRFLIAPSVHVDRLDDAHDHIRHALDLYRRQGDQTGQAHTHTVTAFVLERQGRKHDALEHTEQALALFRAAGHQPGQARSLNNLGWSHAQLGDHHRALTYCRQALDRYQELGSHHGQAMTLANLGYAHHHLGHHAEAIDCCRRALNLFRDLGDRLNEAAALTHLGDTHEAVDDLESASATWRQSLAILDQLNHPDATRVRVRLTMVTHPSRGPREPRDPS